MGLDCKSGCCASFALLKQDYCQPLIDGVCPVPGFTYGPYGNINLITDEEIEEVEQEEIVEKSPIEDLESIDDRIPLPPQFNEDGTGSKPPQEE